MAANAAKRIQLRFSDEYEPGPVILYLEDLEAIHAEGLKDAVKMDLPKIQANVDHRDPAAAAFTHSADAFEDLKALLGDRVNRYFRFQSFGGGTDDYLYFSFSPRNGCFVKAEGDGAELPYRRIVDLLKNRRRRWLTLKMGIPPWLWYGAFFAFGLWLTPPRGGSIVAIGPWVAVGMLLLAMFARGAYWSAGAHSRIYLTRRQERGALWANERRAFWGRVASSVVGGLILVVLTALTTRSCSR
jgi:hypothetical protein